MARANSEQEVSPSVLRRLETVVGDSNDAVTVQDLDGRILAWNRGAERLYGYSEGEALQMNASALVPREGRAEALDLLQAVVGGQKVTAREAARVTKDGRTLDVSLTMTALVDDHGRAVAVATTEHDLTEQKWAVAALLESSEAARRSSVLLNMIADTIPDLVFVKDDQSRLLFANPATLEAIGKPAEAVLGRSDRELFDDPETGAAILENDRRIMASGKPVAIEERVDRPGGRRWYLSTKAPFRDAAGKVIGLVGVSRDITLRKRAEEALRESEERLRLLVQGVRDCAIYMLAPDGTVTSWSTGAEQMFGYGEREIVGQHRRVLFPADERTGDKPLGQLQAALANGHSEQEGWRVRKDGSRLWANVLITPLRGDDGTLRGFANVTRDFTERRGSEAALRESEERYRTLFEHMSEGLAYCRMIYDGERPVDFVYLDVNPAFGVLTGLQDVVGRKVSEVIPGIQESDPDLIERYGRVARLGTHERFETYVKSIRQWFDILVYSPARGDFVAVFDVVTDRKRAEEELRASEERMRLAQEALREADRQKNQFLAMLSHELRNPLAPIRNSLYIMERAAPGSEQARRAQAIIQRQVGQLTWLVDDLLDITRISHGKVQLQRQRLDLNELAHRTAEDHRMAFAKSGVRLVLLPARAEVWVNGDRVRLAQIIGNLLQNAVKFTPSGGKTSLSIESDPAHGQASLVVRDTGSGIAPEMLPRLFHPFSQADATLDRSKGGLGLGLALVKGLVEMHGGAVRAESGGPGQGAAFTITLPLDGTAALTTSARPGAGMAVTPRRVLVIEDNEDAADTLREVLRLDAHVVEVAYSGRDGIEKARAFRPDVVLCDIGLPEMDGYQVARTMRADPELRDLGLIAVSGYAQPDDVTMARDSGFDAHLAKPPSAETLERVLAEVGDARQGRQAPAEVRSDQT